jgi:hypothetical protein
VQPRSRPVYQDDQKRCKERAKARTRSMDETLLQSAHQRREERSEGIAGCYITLRGSRNGIHVIHVSHRPQIMP